MLSFVHHFIAMMEEMACMNRLPGVTMQEKGVSRLAPVDLQTAVRNPRRRACRYVHRDAPPFSEVFPKLWPCRENKLKLVGFPLKQRERVKDEHPMRRRDAY